MVIWLYIEINQWNLNLKVNSQFLFYLSCQFILSVSPSLRESFTCSPPNPISLAVSSKRLQGPGLGFSVCSYSLELFSSYDFRYWRCADIYCSH